MVRIGSLLRIASLVVAKRYIVMFRLEEGADLEQMRVASHDNVVRTKQFFGELDEIHKELTNGYIATLSSSTKRRLQADPEVELVEEDRPIKIEMGVADVHGEDLPSPTEQIPGWTYSQLFNTGIFNSGAKEISESNLPSSSRPAILPGRTRISGLGKNQAETVLSFIIQKDAPWGLNRISGHNPWFEYIEGSGKNVIAYILDTGIDIHHPEFQGRARWGYNAVEGSSDTDKHGHGTHCAGVIGGKYAGIAKDVSLVAVKSLNDAGEGAYSSLIEGIEFVMRDYEQQIEDYEAYAANEEIINGESRARRGWGRYGPSGLLSIIRSIFLQHRERPRAIVNMSIGGARSNAVNFAIRYASRFLNIHFVTAAGNESDNACKFSPASSCSAITVGAIDENDQMAGFSNQGVCVDIFAPGTNILSAWPGGLMRAVSGTSMAAPHVTGMAIVYLSLLYFTPDNLKDRLLKDAEAVDPLVPIDVSKSPYQKSAELLRKFVAVAGLGDLYKPWIKKQESIIEKSRIASLEKLYKRLKA